MLEPTTDFVITNAEWNLLEEQPHNLRTLYFSFRPLMDFDTGIVGTKYKLTMQYMIKKLTVCGHGTRKRSSPLPKEIIKLISRLESIGLIKNLTTPDHKNGNYKIRLTLGVLKK